MNLVAHETKDFDDHNLLLLYKIKCTSQVLVLQQWHGRVKQVRVQIEQSREAAGQPISYSNRLDGTLEDLTSLYDSARRLRQHIVSLPFPPSSIPSIFQQDFNSFFGIFHTKILQWEQLILVIRSRIQKVQRRHMFDQQCHVSERSRGGYGYPTAGGVVYHPKLYSAINQDLIHLSGLISDAVLPRIRYIIDQGLHESASSRPPLLEEVYIANAFTPVTD